MNTTPTKSAAYRPNLDPQDSALPAVTDQHVVPWEELIRRCGAPGWGGTADGAVAPEVLEWARTHGVAIRTHWTGHPGLSPSDAHRVRLAHQKAVAEHDALNAAYREHVAEQKRRAAQEHREAEARQEQQARELEGKARERAAKRAAEEAAALAAAAVEGHGTTDHAFEQFKATRRSA